MLKGVQCVLRRGLTALQAEGERRTGQCRDVDDVASERGVEKCRQGGNTMRASEMLKRVIVSSRSKSHINEGTCHERVKVVERSGRVVKKSTLQTRGGCHERR